MISMTQIKTNKPEQPDKEILTAIENIKLALIIQKENGNQNADFILRRMR